jgi:asparagine synthase (glutamine-hydrolysing)
MCGIVGLLRVDGSRLESADIVALMRDSLRHRGPDDAGIHLDGAIGLGFRRLSVIDIPGGHQPMVDAATGTALVFNGEIYNYRELRQSLEALGHVFRTVSDTEVLLRSYLQWGRGALPRLTGMFAFGVWDPRTRTLLLARDRLGVKPLYWTRVGDTILFASEIKAFFVHPDFRIEPDLAGLSSYLTFRQAVWNLSYLKRVEKVLPGHIVAFENGNANTIRYWQLPVPQGDERLSEEEYLARIEELLTQAVKRCLISDVPLGAYASGGLDSSIIVALMSKLQAMQTRTFSVGYSETDYDEGEHAQRVADHFGTDHTRLLIQQRQFEDTWTLLLRKRDVPLSIPHEIPLYHLSVEMKKTISVAVSGEGADELFGGYGRVQRSPMDWRKVEIARRILGASLSGRLGRVRAFAETPLRWLTCATQQDHFFNVYHWFSFEEKYGLLTPDALKAIDNDQRTIEVFNAIFDEVDAADAYDRVLHVFQKIHLLCLLEKLDAIGMAASVEGRVPFVDHELVEFVVNMPIRHKLRWNSSTSRMRAIWTTADRASERLDTTKYLLRRMGKKLLPAAIVQRKKLGFPTPLDSWLHNGLLASAREVLLDGTTRQRGIFDVKRLERFLATPQNLQYDFYGKKVWMLMNIELWFREVVNSTRELPRSDVRSAVAVPL